MSLKVQYDRCWNQYDERDEPPSWQVVIDLPVSNNVMLYGFGRKLDAEIAACAMQELPIDWEAPEDELRVEWKANGGREKIMEFVCQRLQW